jgi:hypothetical protein
MSLSVVRGRCIAGRQHRTIARASKPARRDWCYAIRQPLPAVSAVPSGMRGRRNGPAKLATPIPLYISRFEKKLRKGQSDFYRTRAPNRTAALDAGRVLYLYSKSLQKILAQGGWPNSGSEFFCPCRGAGTPEVDVAPRCTKPRRMDLVWARALSELHPG